jgi:hypothetical protein
METNPNTPAIKDNSMPDFETWKQDFVSALDEADKIPIEDTLEYVSKTYVVPLQKENERLKNDLLDALDLKEGNGPTALSNVVTERNQLRSDKEELLQALKDLFSNEHIALEDKIYDVRESEGEGWEGPAVKQWSNAVSKAQELISKHEAKING